MYVVSAVIVSVILYLLAGAASARVDETLMSNRNGSDVVEAVVAKLDATYSVILNESNWWKNDAGRTLVNLFIRQMAYVETRDGQDRPSSDGGIWNVDEDVFVVARNHACYLTNINQRISNSQILGVSKISIDWCRDQSLNRSDILSIPIYSGLAVVLYIDQMRVVNISPLTQFYRFWDNFHAGSVNRARWENRVAQLQKSERCSVKSDIVFVVDSSSSITHANFSDVKDFIIRFVNPFSVASNSRIGIIRFGNDAEVYLTLQDGEISTEKKNDTLRKINDMPRLLGRQNTNTAEALCMLKYVRWRDDLGVLRLGIVLTDGKSNEFSMSCGRQTTKEVAASLRNDTIVYAIGVGVRENQDELLHIASKKEFTASLDSFNEAATMNDAVRYQLCSTMSTNIGVNENNNGTLDREDVIRLIMDGIGGEGVSIRFCVMEGKLTFYVSQLISPNRVVSDNSLTITSNEKTSIDCTTIFNQYPTSGMRKRRQQAQTSTLYLTIEGHDEMNTFVLQSGEGNVTFDINECETNPPPCHKSATCYNTDGSYYCECKLGYSGDGVECTSYLFELLVFLIPSAVLGGGLLISCALLVLIGIYVLCHKPKSKRNKQKNKKKSSSIKTEIPMAASTRSKSSS